MLWPSSTAPILTCSSLGPVFRQADRLGDLDFIASVCRPRKSDGLCHARSNGECSSGTAPSWAATTSSVDQRHGVTDVKLRPSSVPLISRPRAPTGRGAAKANWAGCAYLPPNE